MKRHHVLVVEDDRDTAEGLVQLLQSLDCDATTVDNRLEALKLIRVNVFCLVLLDLHIKNEPTSGRGSEEGGWSLLREFRAMNLERIGMSWRFPIVITSGQVREPELAIDLMRQGASHAIAKPLRAKVVSETVRAVLAESGRASHESCTGPAPQASAPVAKLMLTIPAVRRRRSYSVGIGGHEVLLSDAPLFLLVKLVRAKLEGKKAHKTDLGGDAHGGFRGASVLHDALRRALGAAENLILNDHAGNYWLAERIEIGTCNYAALREIGGGRIAKVVDALERLHPPQR